MTGVRFVVQDLGCPKRAVEVHREVRMTSVQVVTQASVTVGVGRNKTSDHRSGRLVLKHGQGTDLSQPHRRTVRNALVNVKHSDRYILRNLSAPIGDPND